MLLNWLGQIRLVLKKFFKTGLNENEVIKIMRKELKVSSFQNWRERVSGKKGKHRKLNEIRNDNSFL